jgi:hypothetical protein
MPKKSVKRKSAKICENPATGKIGRNARKRQRRQVCEFDKWTAKDWQKATRQAQNQLRSSARLLNR